MSRNGYVHGYSSREEERLLDQANTLVELLHQGVVYPQGSRVLEAGCGVGAQTVTLAAQSPEARFTSLDISPESLAAAARRVEEAGLTNVEFGQADIFNLPHEKGSFDHAFVCFVLEHLDRPTEALRAVAAMVRPGGTVTVIEGDHGSCYFHPDRPQARQVWRCLMDCQAGLGGDSEIGRRLYPLMHGAGLKDIRVEPRVVYADAGRPQWVEGFVRRTIIPMVEGVRERALAEEMVNQAEWEAGIAALHETAGPEGAFNYTFFRGVGVAA